MKIVRIFKSFVSWLLFTSVFAACCATALSAATEYLILGDNSHLTVQLYSFIFCCTLVVYNLHYLTKKPVPGVAGRSHWSQQYKYWHYFFVVAGIAGACISLLFLPQIIWWWGAVSGLLAFAYSLPLLPFGRIKYIRQVGWAKILVLAGVWTIATAVMPLLIQGNSLSGYWMLLADRFIFIFVLCLSFDLRDMEADSAMGINTLPNIFGVKTIYLMMDILLVFYVVLGSVAFLWSETSSPVPAIFLTAIAARIAIRYSAGQPSDKIYLGLVDGMMLLQAILTVMFK